VIGGYIAAISLDFLFNAGGDKSDLDPELNEVIEMSSSSAARDLADLTPTNETFPMHIINDLSTSITDNNGGAAGVLSDGEDDEDGDDLCGDLISRFKILNSEPPIAFVDEEDVAEDDL
jgi:hypothetical protein